MAYDSSRQSQQLIAQLVQGRLRHSPRFARRAAVGGAAPEHWQPPTSSSPHLPPCPSLVLRRQGRRPAGCRVGAVQGPGRAGGCVQPSGGAADAVPRPRRHGCVCGGLHRDGRAGGEWAGRRAVPRGTGNADEARKGAGDAVGVQAGGWCAGGCVAPSACSPRPDASKDPPARSRPWRRSHAACHPEPAAGQRAGAAAHH